jgi:Na+/glutamate symporter
VAQISQFGALCTLLVAGKLTRINFKPAQLLFLPASVIGGLYGFAVLSASKVSC